MESGSETQEGACCVRRAVRFKHGFGEQETNPYQTYAKMKIAISKKFQERVLNDDSPVTLT